MVVVVVAVVVVGGWQWLVGWFINYLVVRTFWWA
jgi:hypothetical protein